MAGTKRAKIKKDDQVAVIAGRDKGRRGRVLEVNPVNSGCHRIMPRELAQPGQSVIPVPEPVTIEQIMEQQGWTTLDLLKLDCEGAEVDILFNCSEDVLLKTHRVIGEFHAGPDVFLNGIGARLQNLGFTVTAELNPAAHATFLAVNTVWEALNEKPIEVKADSIGGIPMSDEKPIEYGVPVAKKKPGRKAKKS